MMRFTLFVLFLIISVFSCINKPVAKNNTVSFSSVEINYTDGWTKKFSLIVDSNKIYFVPLKWDSAFYGILPDSIFNTIKETAQKIKDDKNVKSNAIECNDCAVISIKLINNRDTIRIKQSGNLNSHFIPLINTLQHFIDSSHHQTIQAFIQMDKKSSVIPPPPLIEQNK